MKKFLAVILGVILCLGVVMMTGCGVFDGNYKEISKVEVEKIIAEMEATSPAQSIDFTKGYKINADCKSDGSGVGFIKMKADVKQDDALNASGNINFELNENGKRYERLKGNLYQDSKYLYQKVNHVLEVDRVQLENGDFKWKTGSINAVTFLWAYMGIFDYVITEQYFPKLALNIYTYNVNATFYKEETETNIKIKIVFPEGTNYPSEREELRTNAKVKGEVYYLFDKNYNVLGLKSEIRVDANKDLPTYRRIEAKVTIEPCSDKVSLPNDLGDYKIKLMGE